MTTERELLRHTLATLAYRAAKALRDAPESFGDFKPAPTTRTPVEILAHLGDLMDWALHLADGRHLWNDAPPRPWPEEVERFFTAVRKLDERLSSDKSLWFPEGKLFQGPIADALTHVGQIAMLRRMAGAPMKGENYFKAEIEAGRVTADQPPPTREFD